MRAASERLKGKLGGAGGGSGGSGGVAAAAAAKAALNGHTGISVNPRPNPATIAGYEDMIVNEIHGVPIAEYAECLALGEDFALKDAVSSHNEGKYELFLRDLFTGRFVSYLGLAVSHRIPPNELSLMAEANKVDFTDALKLMKDLEINHQAHFGALAGKVTAFGEGFGVVQGDRHQPHFYGRHKTGRQAQQRGGGEGPEPRERSGEAPRRKH